MIKHKNKLTLALSISLGAISMQSMANFQDLANQLPALKQEVASRAQEMLPVLEDVIAKIKAGDIDGLRAMLPKLNAAPAIEFLQNNLKTIENGIRDALANAQEQIPADYAKKAETILAQARQALNNMPNLKSRLEQLKPYADIDARIPEIIANLEKAKDSKQFKAIVSKTENDVKKLKNQVEEIVAQLNEQDLATLRDAAAIIQTKVNNPNAELDLDQVDSVIKGLQAFLRFAPAFPAIAATVSNIAMTVDNVLNVRANAPKQAQMALAYIQDNAKKIKEQLDQARSFLVGKLQESLSN